MKHESLKSVVEWYLVQHPEDQHYVEDLIDALDQRIKEIEKRKEDEERSSHPSISLLPCPFCGTKARFIECFDEHGDSTGWDIGCNGTELDCVALDGFSRFESSVSGEDIARQWNRRS